MSDEENSSGAWSWVIGVAVALGAFALFGGKKTAPITAPSPAPMPAPVIPSSAPSPSVASGPPEAVPHYHPVNNQPLVESANGYVGAEACRECHQHNHQTWFASYHRTMTQKPDVDTVMGDFNDARFTNYSTGYAFHMTREGDDHFITVEPPSNVDRSRHPYPIQTYHLKWPVSLLTGSHHMQGYWVPQGKDRTMSLAPIMYLKEDQRWISRSAAFLEPPGRRHIFEDGSWNKVCIQCHTTDGHTRNGAEGGLDSRVTELGISCESCHGPGEQHVNWRRTEEAKGEDPIVNPVSLSHERSSQVCGACHGRSWVKDASKPSLFKPGDDLFASRYLLSEEPEVSALIDRYLAKHPLPDGVTNAARLLQTYFWSDGMARVSSAEYNAMVASPCYQRGELSCFSCHQLHQSKSDQRSPKEWADDLLGHDRMDNRTCTQCHQEPDYVSAKHTHHQLGSSGSSCLNCHQPYTSYGLMKAIRSHTVSSPSVADTLKTRRPNACNLCHLDKSLGWTSQHLADWYGRPTPALDEDQKGISAAVLDVLKGDASLRALTAWNMGWQPAVEASGSDWLTPYLALLMEDSYKAVRYIAARSLKKQAFYKDFPFDFLGEPDGRKRMLQSLTQNWMAQRKLNYQGPAKPAVLVKTNGVLDGATFARLKEQRDNRPIGLNE